MLDQQRDLLLFTGRGTAPNGERAGFPHRPRFPAGKTIHARGLIFGEHNSSIGRQAGAFNVRSDYGMVHPPLFFREQVETYPISPRAFARQYFTPCQKRKPSASSCWSVWFAFAQQARRMTRRPGSILLNTPTARFFCTLQTRTARAT